MKQPGNGPTASTPESTDAPAERQCGWCSIDISEKGTRAQYCGIQHKKNAAAKRFRERNPHYYARYSRSDTRLAYNETHKKERQDYARQRSRRLRIDPTYAAQQSAWWQANRHKAIKYNRVRRDRKINNPGSVGVSDRDWIRLVIRYRSRCAYCGNLPKHKIEMDHVIPISKGGRHAIGNVLPCCEKCNNAKSSRLLAAWRYHP